MDRQRKKLVAITDHPDVKLRKKLHFKIKNEDDGEVKDYVCFMSEEYLYRKKRYDSFKIRHNDAFVVSAPRSGSTWTQEIVWCVLKGLDHEDGHKILEERFHFLERDTSKDLWVNDDPRHPLNYQCTLDILEKEEGGRLIKSHFPAELLPISMWTEKPKIVYICRDPRDVCISVCNRRLKRTEAASKSLTDVANTWISNTNSGGSYWDHVLKFWKMRNEEHILFIRFEDLKEDLPASIRKVAAFFEKDLNDEELFLMAHYLTFETMKTNAAINKTDCTSYTRRFKKKYTSEWEGTFLRKGEVGGWKNHYDSDMQEKFKEWTEKNVAGTDFPYYRDYE